MKLQMTSSVLVLAVSLTACSKTGLNKAPGAADTAKPQPGASSPSTGASASPANQTKGQVSKTASQKPNPVASKESDQKTGLSAKPQAQAAKAPNVAEKGADQLTKTQSLMASKSCEPKSKTIKLTARALTEDEMTGIHLPYVSTHKAEDLDHRHGILREAMGFYTGKIEGTRYVRDTQILFAFDLKGIPARESIKSIDSAVLDLSATKVAMDSHRETEVLCFVDERICSGELFTERNWQANINDRHFFHGNHKMNSYFRDRLLATRTGQLNAGGFDVYKLSEALPVERLIEGNSNGMTVEKLIYGSQDKSLKMVIADNSYVRKAPELVITYTEGCAK